MNSKQTVVVSDMTLGAMLKNRDPECPNPENLKPDKGQGKKTLNKTSLGTI